MHIYNARVPQVKADRFRVQGHPWLHSKLMVILGYTGPISKIAKPMKLPNPATKMLRLGSVISKGGLGRWISS